MALAFAPCLLGAQMKLGTVHFPNSGNRAAQEPFIRGLALLHSFEYDEAAAAFRDAERADASFALPYWFEASTFRHPLWGEEDLAAARAVLARLGRNREARLARAANDRERGFGAAVEALFADTTEAVRTASYADSMRSLARQHPDDIEIAAFTSVALMGAAPYARTARLAMMLQAETLATRVFVQAPDHPGGAHYLIHAVDRPDAASRGLAAARAYARIAPDAEHALHMPSHIFVQLGMWTDDVASNERAWKASRAEVARTHQPLDHVDFHDLEWLQYGYLEQGRYAAARAIFDTARVVLNGSRGGYDNPDARYALCQLGFQYASETGDWISSTRELRGDVATADFDKLPNDVSMRTMMMSAGCSYVHAVVAAMSGDTATVDAMAASFGRRQGPLAVYYAAQLSGVAARARADRATALVRFREAAAMEDRFTPVGPPNELLALELLGGTALDAGLASEAAEAFAHELRLTPNRPLSLLGLARARAKLGDAAGARDAYRQLADVWQRADDTPLVREARAGAKR